MTSNAPRVRFAPSPTGLLHIGGLRTALYNFLYARQTGGVFVVRIEDTDRARFVEGAEKYIFDSLTWAGILPDESPLAPGPFGPYRQSERLDTYRAVVDGLIASGRAYLAFDTEDEIEALRKSDPAGNARYDATTRTSMRNSLTLSASEVDDLVTGGQPYVVRLRVDPGRNVEFDDVVRGHVAVATDELDDQVLLKSDGFPTYHLANVVDDHEMRITHVIRGEEWLPSTPKHMLLYESFGWDAPRMAHLPLILSPTGGKLSKRSSAKYGIPVFVLDYRDAGFEAAAVVNYLALLGWHPGSDREFFSLDDLVAEFGLDRVGSAGVQFDMDKLRWFNEQHLRSLGAVDIAAAMRPHVDAAGYSADEAHLVQIAELLRDRVTLARDVVEFDELFRDPEEYDPAVVSKRWRPESAEQIKLLAGELASADNWTPVAIDAAFEKAAAASAVGKGRLMPIIRLAVSGKASGPDLVPTLEVLGRETTVRRLRAAVEKLGPA